MTFPNESGLPELMRVLSSLASTGAVTAGAYATGLAFFQGIAGGGPAPVAAAGAGSGAGATAGSQAGHDLGGSFIITTAGTPAAGALAAVTFGTPLTAAPAMVLVTCWDQTAAASVAVGVTSVSKTGFTVSTGATPVTGHSLLVSYLVLYG
jgi:hypothetical protein